MARFVLFTEKYDPSSKESWKEAETVAQQHLEAVRLALKEHEEYSLQVGWDVVNGEAGRCEVGVFFQPRDVTLDSEATRAFVARARAIFNTYMTVVRETCDFWVKE